MRLFVTTTILFVLSVLVVPALGELPSGTPTEAEVQEIVQTESESALSDPQIAKDSLPIFSPAGENLVERMRDGFLKNIKQESSKWYECGQLTPEEDKPLRAEKIARYTLAALREYDLKWLNPWGVLAVIYRESRGDQCAIGPNSRKAARNLKIIEENKPFNQWTKEDIETVFDNPKWKRARGKIGADLGLGQQVWKRYARILDTQGNDKCGSKDLRCRIPTLEEILSVENGPRVVATGMLTRKIWHRDVRAWTYWPGTIRNVRYDIKITALIYALGGKDGEKAVW
jgi:hypothetical protein